MKASFGRLGQTMIVGKHGLTGVRAPFLSGQGIAKRVEDLCAVSPPPRARISARTRAWPLSLFSDKAQLAHQTQAYVLPHWARISARIRVLGMPALGNMRRKSAFRVMGPSEGAQVAMALFTTTLASTRMRTDASFR